jgi:hypothetical protein
MCGIRVPVVRQGSPPWPGYQSHRHEQVENEDRMQLLATSGAPGGPYALEDGGDEHNIEIEFQVGKTRPCVVHQDSLYYIYITRSPFRRRRAN